MEIDLNMQRPDELPDGELQVLTVAANQDLYQT